MSSETPTPPDARNDSRDDLSGGRDDADARPVAALPPALPTPAAATPFLDAPALIERSRVRRARVPTWPLLFVGLGLLLAANTPDGGPAATVARVLAPLTILGFWIGMLVYRRHLAVRLRAETDAVVALDEFVQLRRWPEAADLVGHLLARPMLLPDRRLAALASLATVLVRYHRFADARSVHDYLLAPDDGGFAPDGPTGHAIRVARAMTMLREDHLVDADRAMNELRREVSGARDAVRRDEGVEAAGRVESGGVVLLDLYRDVKTRHYEEAVLIFDRALPMLREQLGMRVADAWALVAMARHGLGLDDAARLAWANATSLAPGVELTRRYPEIAPVAEACAATRWPTA